MQIQGDNMSADPLDEASSQEQQARDRAIARARAAVLCTSRVFWHTHCAWCHEPTPDGREYCSYGVDSCAVDARREQEIRCRQGLR